MKVNAENMVMLGLMVRKENKELLDCQDQLDREVCKDNEAIKVKLNNYFQSHRRVFLSNFLKLLFRVLI